MVTAEGPVMLSLGASGWHSSSLSTNKQHSLSSQNHTVLVCFG